MGLHEKTAEVFFCVLEHLAIAQIFGKTSWLCGRDSGLVRLDCHLARLPLQTLRILHLPGNEISKLEDPCHDEMGTVSLAELCIAAKMIFTCMGVMGEF